MYVDLHVKGTNFTHLAYVARAPVRPRSRGTSKGIGIVLDVTYPPYKPFDFNLIAISVQPAASKHYVV